MLATSFTWLTAVAAFFLFSLPGLAASDFSDRDIVQIIADNPDIRTGDDLIAKFPEDLRRHYIILQHSRSRQGATAESPRIILFEPDGDLFVTFNGSPEERGFNKIETIQYLPDSREFRFGEFELHDDRAPSFTENPPACQQCHQTKEPIWQTYAMWPDALPSSDGSFAYSPENRARFDRFVANSANSDRYRHLIDIRTNPRRHSNRELSSNLVLKNRDTVIRRMQATKHYEAYLPAIRAALSQCLNFEKHIPRALAEQFHKSLIELIPESSRLSKLSMHLKGDRFAITSSSRPSNRSNFHNVGNIPPLAKLRYLLERDGANISAWFYGNELRDYSGSRSSLFRHLIHEIGMSDCDPSSSIASLTQLMESVDDPVATNLPPFVDNSVLAVFDDESMMRNYRQVTHFCTGCHRQETELDVPAIPFDNPAALAEYLQEDDKRELILSRLRLPLNNQLHMPPGRTLNANVINNFATSLNAMGNRRKP